MQLRKRLLAFLGIFISALFLWLAFTGLHPEAVLGYLQALQWGWIFVGVGLFFISMVLIAWRWGFLLESLRPLPVRYLSELVSICYMGNNVYPMRAGEFLRVFLLQRDYNIPIARTTTTIFIERIFDGFVMLAFVVIPLQFIDIDSPTLRQAVDVATPLFAGLLVVFLLFALNPSWIRAITRRVATFLPEKVAALLYKVSEDVISGMEGLRSPRRLVWTITASLATWLFNAAVYWAVSFAFDLNVSFLLMLVATGAVNLAGVLPASPGQVGVFELAVTTVLQTGGIVQDRAFAYAIVVHLVIWLPPTLLGLFLLARRGFGLSSVARLQAAEEPKPA